MILRFNLHLRSTHCCLIAAALLTIALATAHAQPPATSLASSVPAPAPKPDSILLDKELLIYSEIDDGKPVRTEDQNWEEFTAYNEVVKHAHRYTADQLEAAARRDVTFKDLVVPTRREFKLDLVFFEGKLHKVRKLSPTVPLKAAGVNDLYEAWMIPTGQRDPVCVLMTDLPAGLVPELQYQPTLSISLAGYFFKTLRYDLDAPDPNLPTAGTGRLAPLLITRTITLRPEPVPSFWSGDFLIGWVALISFVTFVVLGLYWYFRRGDRAYRMAKAERQARNNPFGTPDGPAPTPPSDGWTEER